MEETTGLNQVPKNYDIASFTKAIQKMIGKNAQAYSQFNFMRERSVTKNYTLEEISNIIQSGSLAARQKLSNDYFSQDGYYKHIIIHYATLLKYNSILIPNPINGKSLSTNHIKKKYYSAMEFVDSIDLKGFCVNCALQALLNGCYYGVRIKDKKNFVVMDLPPEYCRTNYKDEYNNDLIQFNVTYFDTLDALGGKDAALKIYPKVITKYYENYKANPKLSCWVVIPSEIGICFPFLNGTPYFLNTLIASEDYKQVNQDERERRAEEIRKIIVQKIPHLEDGRLLFEPEEGAEIHKASVDMLKHNKNLNVLTTYTDVDAIVSQSQLNGGYEELKQSEHNIYAQSGVSGDIFSSSGSNTIDISLTNDLACMMVLANKFSIFFTNLINREFSNSNINFKFKILPISYYNESDYIDKSFKIANSGYSFLLPALAMDISQSELSNLKDLENDVLDLKNKLLPLTSAYTQSSDEGGRPTKKETEKDERTLENEASKDKTGGS